MILSITRICSICPTPCTVGEAFVAYHIQDLLSSATLDYTDTSEQHVEGGDATALRLQLGEQTEHFVPDYVDDPTLQGRPAQEITEMVAGGIEVKTTWNSLFSTLYPEEECVSLPFGLWSNESRTQPGWLVRIMYLEAFHVPGQDITTVQPHTIVFLLAEYENVFASVVFKNSPELFDRLWTIARRDGFDLDHLPLGEEANQYADHNPRIKNETWHVPLHQLQDLATVTMIADQPFIRPDIRIGSNSIFPCLSTIT